MHQMQATFVLPFRHVVSNAYEAEDGPRIDAAFSQYFRLLLVQIFPQRLVHQLKSGTLSRESAGREAEEENGGRGE